MTRESGRRKTQIGAPENCSERVAGRLKQPIKARTETNHEGKL